MRVTKEDVIRAASDLADQQGLNGVSLKSVAEQLGLRAPSLYNHVLSTCSANCTICATFFGLIHILYMEI